MSSRAVPITAVSGEERRGHSVGTRLALYAEVVRGGIIELWAHKLRSILTLTLLMLRIVIRYGSHVEGCRQSQT